MSNTVCDDFNLYDISERIRYALSFSTNIQRLREASDLVERCLHAYRAPGPEGASARCELQTMKEGWFERWEGGEKRIKDMMQNGNLDGALKELLKLDDDLPPRRT